MEASLAVTNECARVYTIHTSRQLSTAAVSVGFLRAWNLLDLWPWIKGISWQMSRGMNSGRAVTDSGIWWITATAPSSLCCLQRSPEEWSLSSTMLTYFISCSHEQPLPVYLTGPLRVHIANGHLKKAWGRQLKEFGQPQSLLWCFVSLFDCGPCRAQVYADAKIHLRLHLPWCSNISIFKT